MTLKPEKNKWQYGVDITKCPPFVKGFYPYVRVWFLKFHSLPPEGEMFDKQHYKGFFFEWMFKRMIAIKMYSFYIPLKLRIFLVLFGVKTHDLYVIPVWFKII